jgi:hypothetical protein
MQGCATRHVFPLAVRIGSNSRIIEGQNRGATRRPYGVKYVADGLTETLDIFTIRKFEDLKELIWSRLHNVQNPS